MVTDLVQIRRLAEEHDSAYWRFRAWMKEDRYPDEAYRAEAARIQSQIDCRACANCCRRSDVELTSKDIDRLSRHLDVTPDQFRSQFTTRSPDGDTLLRRGESGCVFLSGNDCSVYAARPESCAGYPHLVGSEDRLSFRMFGIVHRASECPIVFNSLESWMQMAAASRGPKPRAPRR